MKPVIIIAIAVVLLIPIPVFAEDSLTCPTGTYHGLDNSGNDACRDIETNQIVQGVTKQNNQNKVSNPIDDIIQFILQIFQGFNPEETVKDVTKGLSLDSIGNTFENTVDDISNSIPIDMGTISENSKSKLEDCSKYKNEVKYSADVDKVFTALQKTKECDSYNINAVKQVSSQGTVLTQHTNGIFLKHEYCHKVQTNKCQPNEPQVITTDYRKISNPEYSLEGKNISKFSLGHIGVIEKDDHNLIILDIHVEPFPTGNGAQTGSTSDNPSYFVFSMALKNENGKIYTHLPATCNISFGPYISIPNSGATVSHCYKVEKNLDTFDVVYDESGGFSQAKQNFVGTFLLN